MPHLQWWVYIIVFIPLWALLKRSGGSESKGKVVGIVGRMGSGKSYMATRIAYQRMRKGAKIVTNFSMHLECPNGKHRKWPRFCPCKLDGQWQRFYDWPDLLPLSDAVVIIDEADLFAPSHDFNAITDEVRGKMKMARKYRLDIYWITQHEARINRILREQLSNEIGICRSWFGGKYFTVKFYEPMEIRRRNKHTWRQGYFLNKTVANLYDTLELIQGSAYAGDETMANYNRIMSEEQARRDAVKAKRRTSTNRIARANGRRMEPCEHERRRKIRAGNCTICHTAIPADIPVLEDSGILEDKEVFVE